MSGTLSGIDNARFILSGAGTFSKVGATSYSNNRGSETIWEATASGGVLDLSSVQSLTFGAGGGQYFKTVRATGGGTVKLSGLTNITISPGQDDVLDFVASDSGVIDLGGLRAFNAQGNGNERVRFFASGSGRIQLGELTGATRVVLNATDPGTSIELNRGLVINAGQVTITNGAAVKLGKHFSHRLTAEADFQAATGIFEFRGSGLQLFEVAGLDLGPINPGNNNNFGIGRLVLGTDISASALQLTDLIDNGHRGVIPEALYIFGIGQGTLFDSLDLRGGSTLYLDNINVYARENGNWIWLNSLFGPGQSVVPYAGGYLHLPSPGAIPLLSVAGLWATRRRRDRA